MSTVADEIWAILHEIAQSQKETDRILKELSEDRKETDRELIAMLTRVRNNSRSG
jgi:hypothetical protein